MTNDPVKAVEGGEVRVSIKRMPLSDGRADYFVALRCGGREVTPHVFREEYKAAYHVALYSWLFNGAEKPDLVAFNPDDWPAQATLSAPQAGEGVRESIARICYELSPHYEMGESVDGFVVSPGGNLSWSQAKARDAEFGDDRLFIKITKEAYAAADSILASLQPAPSLPDHAAVVEALQKLMDCARAIVGADPQDERSTEAFEMFWAAMAEARAALSTLSKAPEVKHSAETNAEIIAKAIASAVGADSWHRFLSIANAIAIQEGGVSKAPEAGEKQPGYTQYTGFKP